MKRFNSIIAIIGLAIIATAVTVVSCKKEQVPDTRNQSKTTLVQILDFKQTHISNLHFVFGLILIK